MSYPENFQGIGVSDPKDWTHPTKIVFPAKKFDDNDIDVEIDACGVCGSDVHCAASNWFDIKKNQVVGHEIIGRVIKVGSKCKLGMKVGDRVGVGAQALSCGECNRCKTNNESYCTKNVWTYGLPYEDGYVSQGGYASHVRVHENFVFPIPEKLKTTSAAPLLCGGLTVYSPLVRGGCGPNKTVGIVGIGGIGHMGILLAKAMGANVVAISRSNAKKADSLKLGADKYIATAEDKDWATHNFDSLDLMVVCASSLSELNFEDLARVMKINSKILSISVPPKEETINVSPLHLLGVTIGTSALGSREEMLQLLKLCADKNIEPWVETVPISEKGVNEVFERMEKGDVKFRFTLTDFDKEFKDFRI